jgi:uncharacterized protein involved in response to NO
MENLNSIMLVVACIYMVLVLAVSIYGLINKVGFNLSFVWSLCFTPIVGYFFVKRVIRKRETFNNL